MKKNIFFLLVLLLASCNDGDGNEDAGIPTFLHSYVVEYVEGNWMLTANPSLEKNGFRLDINSRDSEHYKRYISPDIGGEADVSAKFLEIATRNNDLSYNRRLSWLSYMDQIAPAEHFSRIRVKCSGTDWDATHPWGADISDLATMTLYSFADYIGSGYVGDNFKMIKKKLSEMTEADLFLFQVQRSQCPQLYFDSYPASDIAYVLEVTLETTEGKEYKAYYRNVE